MLLSLQLGHDSTGQFRIKGFAQEQNSSSLEVLVFEPTTIQSAAQALTTEPPWLHCRNLLCLFSHKTSNEAAFSPNKCVCAIHENEEKRRGKRLSLLLLYTQTPSLSLFPSLSFTLSSFSTPRHQAKREELDVAMATATCSFS